MSVLFLWGWRGASVTYQGRIQDFVWGGAETQKVGFLTRGA